MLFMITETFRGGDPTQVYERLEERGRMTPDDVTYVASWVATDLRRCYQVMECDGRELLDEWMARWDDLVLFDVAEVVSTDEARKLVSARARPERPDAP